MKIALIHDQLNEFGGAERVLLAMTEIWPDAPIYTAYYKAGSPAWDRFKHKDVRVSWAHHIPFFSTKLHSPLRFMAPYIWNSFDFSGYDVIVASSSWYITKGFAKKGNAIEICYCHTPPRWLYGYPTSVQWRRFGLVRVYAAVVGFFMRQYDFHASARVNYFIANSKETASRIKKFYRRDSQVIYPPVEIPLPKHEPPSDRKRDSGYYLIVGRLTDAKKIHIAIEACNALHVPLKIVGIGTQEASLHALAGPTVTFEGAVTDSKLSVLYSHAKAFLALATDEDFGLTPVEAMAHGTPVIAYRGGGYRETVVDGVTGIFYDSPTVSGIQGAISAFSRVKKDWRGACRSQAEKFSSKKFKSSLERFVTSHAV